MGIGKYHQTRKAPILLRTIPPLEGIGTCACLSGFPRQAKSGSAAWKKSSDIEGADIIVDGLAVWGRNDEEHDKRLEQVLERALKSGLKLNSKKCKFNVNRITYVGHIFSSNGLEPNPECMEAIVDMLEPNNKEELAAFMGMITHLGKFVQNLSAVTAPLRELTQKSVAWSWETCHQQAFNELKQHIANAPPL